MQGKRQAHLVSHPQAEAAASVPVFRGAYGYDRDAASAAGGLSCGPGRTRQEFKEEADINVIVKRFGIVGKLPLDIRVPQTGDFTEVVDYQTALNAVIQADSEFMRLPGSVRERFGNDPQALLEFVADPANLDEAVRLGIAQERPKRDVEAVPPPPAKGG